MKQLFKPNAKTIVTEIRHFIVDSVRRIGAGHHAVSALVDKATLQQLDIVVEQDKPYTFKDIHHVFSISSPSPVDVTLTAFGEIPEPEQRSEHMTHTGTLTCDPLVLGNFFNITLHDLDVFASSVDVTVFNKRTGETENVRLHAVKTNVYKGFIETNNTEVPGVNFDGVLYAKSNDEIVVTYFDAAVDIGLSQEITVSTFAQSPFKETTLFANHKIYEGNYFVVVVENGREEENQVLQFTNDRSGHRTDAELVRMPDGNLVAKVELGTADGFATFETYAGDIITARYTNGRDETGKAKIVEIAKEVYTPGVSPFTGTLTVSSPVVKQYDTFKIRVTDHDFNNKNVVVMVNNYRAGTSIPVVLQEIYEDIGIYEASVEMLPSYGIAGDNVELTYADYTNNTEVKTATFTVAANDDSTDDETESPIVLGVSRPVTIRVDKQWFLNGRFAGTIAISAIDNNPVRCSVVKA